LCAHVIFYKLLISTNLRYHNTNIIDLHQLK
jgi:hypothetical protein